MSDREEKLAAARKKLKEFQNQKNKENCDDYFVNQSQFNKNSGEQNFSNDSCAFQANHETTIEKNDPHRNKLGNLNESNSGNQQQPSLANYFQNSNKSEFFFDVVPKQSNGEVDVSSINLILPEKSNVSAASSYFTENMDNNESLTSICTFPATSDMLSDQKEFSKETETKTINKEEMELLQQELHIAESKIIMQADALDVITADREDLQSKLKKTTDELAVCKEKVSTLQSQLEENRECEKKLRAIVTELEKYKEDILAKELLFEQNISDLREKNDELMQNLEIQKKRNNILEDQLEESKSQYEMLSLKFQQLGFDVNSDKSNYQTISEECEVWKHKYADLEERLKTLMFEREHTNDEYRQYIDGLKAEIQQTSVELQNVSSENQVLTKKIVSQTQHISNLEKQLQTLPPINKENIESKENIIAELREETESLKREKEQDKQTLEQMLLQLADYELAKERVYELERELEDFKVEIKNSKELQMAVESNKVAASQAITQNNKLKAELEKLNQIIEHQNNEKTVLNNTLEQERMKNEKLTALFAETQKNFCSDIMTNDAAINTETGTDGVETNVYGKANLEAMLQLQEKFKSVLDKMADLTEEKQQLEHLVLQLQCETETIEEYVALYQKQRSVLQQKARETDLKMERVVKEKERLLNIIRSILTTCDLDNSLVKQIIQHNLSSELSEELALDNNNINNGFDTCEQHPSCPCCSGKLIIV